MLACSIPSLSSFGLSVSTAFASAISAGSNHFGFSLRESAVTPGKETGDGSMLLDL